jgi:hypothetical protein
MKIEKRLEREDGTKKGSVWKKRKEINKQKIMIKEEKNEWRRTKKLNNIRIGTKYIYIYIYIYICWMVRLWA